MSDSPGHDDHWRRLAEELGLDAGPPPEQAPPPPPELIGHEEEAAVEPEVKELPRGRRRRSPEPGEPPLEPPPVEDAGLFAPPAEAEIEGADVEAAAVPEVRPEAAEEASEEVAEQQAHKRRRRRSRRKKKGDAAPEAAAGEVPAGEEAAAEPAAEPDDEPVEEVTRNWNVPSWDELIASLYRPER